VGGLKARVQTMLSDAACFIYKAGPVGLMFKKREYLLFSYYQEPMIA
jgi:hypothetical protein